MVGMALIPAEQGRGETTSRPQCWNQSAQVPSDGRLPTSPGAARGGLEAPHGLTEACSWGCVLPHRGLSPHMLGHLQHSELRKEKEAVPHNRIQLANKPNQIAPLSKSGCLQATSRPCTLPRSHTFLPVRVHATTQWH